MKDLETILFHGTMLLIYFLVIPAHLKLNNNNNYYYYCNNINKNKY